MLKGSDFTLVCITVTSGYSFLEGVYGLKKYYKVTRILEARKPPQLLEIYVLGRVRNARCAKIL